MTRPTLHITNWSSRTLHGPGRKLSIMSAPRRWEHGDGSVAFLTPELTHLRGLQSGEMSMMEYQFAIEARWEVFAWRLQPGALLIDDQGDDHEGIGADPARRVRNGDTLLCACSRETAARGECHRTWAARVLAGAGWRVLLDGVEVTP
jgi:hypothetical protein